MPPHYRRGADFERKIMGLFQEAGYVVLRSAVSKGSADLIALDVSSTARPVLIQCKRTKAPIGPGEWNQFFRVCTAVNALPLIASAVFRESDGKVTAYRLHRITGERAHGTREADYPWTEVRLRSVPRGTLPDVHG